MPDFFRKSIRVKEVIDYKFHKNKKMNGKKMSIIISQMKRWIYIKKKKEKNSPKFFFFELNDCYEGFPLTPFYPCSFSPPSSQTHVWMLN